jgi:hypothetical protein
MPNDRAHEDFVHDLLITRQQALMPYDFRKKTGMVSEIDFVATQAMALVHQALSVMNVLHAGIESLVFGGEIRRGSPAQKAQIAKAAKEIVANDYGPMNSIMVVNLCTAIEVGVEDTLLVALRFKPGTIERCRVAGLIGDQVPTDRDLTYDEARRVLYKLRDWGKKGGAGPPDGWLRTLSLVGVDVTLKESERAALRELVQLRNAIVHSAQRADAKTAEATKHTKAEKHRVFSVKRAAMGVYCDACTAFANAIFQAAQNPKVDS